MIKIDAKRHIAKTISWRVIGTIDTFLLSWFISGDPFIGLTIGGAEVVTKMTLYYLHERAWFGFNWGIQTPRKALQPIQWRPANANKLETQVAFVQEESDEFVKRVKIKQLINNPKHYIAYLSYRDKANGDRLSEVLTHDSLEEVESTYNIKIDE